MTDNVNGTASMTAVKNPGKLSKKNAFWENAFKQDDTKDVKPLPKKKKRKKKKGAMASMWENKVAKNKEEMNKNVIKPKKKRKSWGNKKLNTNLPIINPTNTPNTTNIAPLKEHAQEKEEDAAVEPKEDNTKSMISLNDENDRKEKEEETAKKVEEEPPKKVEDEAPKKEDDDSQQKEEDEPQTKEIEKEEKYEIPTEKPKPKPKKNNKISALAGKIKFNPMALRGGLPPSLRKKREEQKEKSGDIPDQKFSKPTIPSTSRRKPTKKNIITLENEKINDSLKAHLSESFTFDEGLIINQQYLLLYLRDIVGIDLSSFGNNNDNIWDKELLLSCIKEVFGDKVVTSWGFMIRLL